MMELSDGRKSFRIGLAVLIQYRSVTDTQPPSHPATQPASHVAVAITLNAQASSLKSAQRRRKHCALAVVRRSQKYRSPLPGGVGRPKFNQLEIVTSLYLYPQTQFGEDRCTHFRVIVVKDPQTNKHTHTQTDRVDYNTLRRSFATAQCNNNNNNNNNKQPCVKSSGQQISVTVSAADRIHPESIDVKKSSRKKIKKR